MTAASTTALITSGFTDASSQVLIVLGVVIGIVVALVLFRFGVKKLRGTVK